MVLLFLLLNSPDSILNTPLQYCICLYLSSNSVKLIGTKTTILRDFLGIIAKIYSDPLRFWRQISQGFRLITGEISGGTADNSFNLAIGLLAA